MLSNALSKRVSSIAALALVGASKAQTEEESRLLLAALHPKITAVGEDANNDGYVTVQFTTGPNIKSYNFTASCYAQNTTLPTTSCKAVELAGLTPAGTSATGETGKKYAKVSANVTGLLANETYDCFLYTDGPVGLEKCKYVGSSDVSCILPEDPDFGLEADQVISTTSFEFVPNVPENGNPPVADDANVFGYTCIAGADQTCADVTSFDFATDGVDLASFDGTTPVTIGALTPNTDYTCFGLVDNVCTGSPTDDFVCGTPFALQTPVTNANTLTTSPAGVSIAGDSTTGTFDFEFIVDVGGGAVPLADMTFAVGCVDGGATPGVALLGPGVLTPAQWTPLTVAAIPAPGQCTATENPVGSGLYDFVCDGITASGLIGANTNTYFCYVFAGEGCGALPSFSVANGPDIPILSDLVAGCTSGWASGYTADSTSLLGVVPAP